MIDKLASRPKTHGMDRKSFQISQNLKCLVASRDERENIDFIKILFQLEKLYSRFMESHGSEFNICPFHENEQTIVSLFQAATACAGFLSLSEVAIEKKRGNGRADLWIIANDRQYWMEFKRTSYEPSHHAYGIKACMESARGQASNCDYEKGHFGVACVVAAQRPCLKGLDITYEEYADESDLAFEIRSTCDLKNYIYLSFVNGTGSP